MMTKLKPPVWLLTMTAARRFMLVVVVVLVTLLALFIGLYYVSKANPSTVSHIYKIAERSPLPILDKNNAEEKTEEVVDLVNDEDVLTDEHPLVVEDDSLAKTERVERDILPDMARRKSPIVAPYSAPKVFNTQKASTDKSSQAEQLSDEDNANLQFYKSHTNQHIDTSVATQITQLEYKILQGKMIEAVLEPQVNSDLPGMICAIVQRDVYGEQGRQKLIPWGSRVCGQYSTELKKGQGRLFAIWNTLRRPDGVQITLDSVGADQLGTAGMGGYVDTHFAETFSVSAMLAIIGVGGQSSHRYGRYGDFSSYYYRDSVRQAATRTAEKLLAPYANMTPTIVVPAGERIRIYVNKNLDFSVLAKAKESDVLMVP